MKAILQKWYVGLIILPIIINYLTSYISLPDILEDWQTTIIVTEFICIIILVNELRIAKKTGVVIQPRIEVKTSDKVIVKDLLDTLNVVMFQKDIYEQDSWYGYRREAINRVINFTEKADLITHVTTDENLNKLINSFNKSLADFIEFTAKELYGIGDGWYEPDKSADSGKKRIEKVRPVMNRMAKDSFGKLELLLKYLRSNDYL